VPRDPHTTARREGPADPAGEVPGPAGGGSRDHEGPGALPVRLHGGGVRRPRRPAGGADHQGRSRLPPHLLRERVRRGAGPDRPRHRPSGAAAVRRSDQGVRGHRRQHPPGDLGRRHLAGLRAGAGAGLRRAGGGRAHVL
ncbi:MAG: Cell division protein MraZ, partial [uncultured Frankineae bacterium]